MSKVSVIIPVYNVEKYLRQCLDSVVNQTLSDIEIICVNDCSPDNSLAILEEYAAKDNRIKIIDLQENKGIGNARNIAMKEALSEYVMFLDSDDWLELNACELAYNKIKKNNNDFVFFNLFNYYESTGEIKPIYNKTELFYEKFGEDTFSPMDIDFHFLGNAFSWLKIYNTKFLLDNNIEFSLGAFEDQVFNVKIFMYAKSISILNVPLYYYRRRLGAITQDPAYWSALLLQKRKIFELLKSVSFEDKEKYIRSVVIAAINSVFVFYNRYSKIDKKCKKIVYNDVNKFFNEIYPDYESNYMRKYINEYEYMLIKNNRNYYSYCFRKYILDNIFSVKTIYKNDKSILRITILGIKINIRKTH